MKRIIREHCVKLLLLVVVVEAVDIVDAFLSIILEVLLATSRICRHIYPAGVCVCVRVCLLILAF